MFKKRYISKSPKISVKYFGKGDLIIFLHGIGGNKDNWDLDLAIRNLNVVKSMSYLFYV